MRRLTLLLSTVVLLAAATLSASGPIGFYAIVDKVVFEPNEQAPERIQLWGAFMYAQPGAVNATSVAKRGYLYFRASPSLETVRREWADLKSVAGTGQAVGFGRWVYIGAFPMQPDVSHDMGIYAPSGGRAIDLRVRPASEPVANPIDYITNAGVVKITEASHAGIIKQLRDALKP